MPKSQENTFSMPTIIAIGAGQVVRHYVGLTGPHSITIVSRSPYKNGADGLSNINFHQEDIRRSDILDTLLHQTQSQSPLVVIDSVPPAPDGSVEANEIIARAVAATAEAHVIYLSSTGVYACDDGSIVEEDGTLDLVDPKAVARAAAERAYQTLAARAVLLRISGIYGAQKGAIRAPAQSEPTDRFSNRIHIHDLCRVIDTIAKRMHSTFPAGVYNVNDNYPAPSSEIAAYLSSMHASPQRPTIASKGGSARTLRNRKISNQKLINALSPFELMYPSYREGFAAQDS